MKFNPFVVLTRKTRIRYAAKFGRIEHKHGRLMGLFSICTLILHFTPFDAIELIFSILTVLSWMTYLGAHGLEKKMYGNFGPRG